MSSIILCIFIFILLCCKKYILNYQIYEITAFNQDERSLLYYLYIYNHQSIFFNMITNEAALPINVLVQDDFKQEFENYLHLHSIEYIHRNNISVPIKMNNEKKLQSNANEAFTNVTNMFLNYDEFNEWVNEKINKHAYLSKIVIGSSYHNRDLIVLKVSTGKRKSAVFINGGEVGRDWMSSAIILNVINRIFEDNKDLTLLTKYYDFYFLPIFNPDGYQHSIKDITWTKNRKNFYPPLKCPIGQLAIGVNIERNWYLSKSEIKDNKCNAVYMGDKPLSEEESKALSKFLNTIANNLMAYINLKGFERLLTLPYGYTGELSNNHYILMEILSSASKKLFTKYNTTYCFGSTSSLLYNFTGNSPDWVKENFNVPIVYTVYMKYKDYLLPNASHILPLTEQFITIINDTLIYSNNLYGSLFNNQGLCKSKDTVIIMSIVSLFSHI